MALTQKQGYELDLYTQLNPGDPGYINPDELMYIVSHSSFENDKRVPSSNFGQSGSLTHIEKDTITDLASKSVTKNFGSAFTARPVTVAFNVYRYAEQGSDYVIQDVLYKIIGSGWLTTTGFSITIDDSEILTGVYIDYCFI